LLELLSKKTVYQDHKIKVKFTEVGYKLRSVGKTVEKESRGSFEEKGVNGIEFLVNLRILIWFPYQK